MWLYLAIVGYTLLGFVAILDKVIVSNEKVPPVVYAFYSSVVALPLLALVPFGVVGLGAPVYWIIAFIGGAASLLGLYTMYVGFEASEVSRIGPLIGAAIPFFIIFLSRFFIGEVITGRQLLAVAILIIGSLMITWENSSNYKGWHRGVLWGIFSGFWYAIFHVASKYIYSRVDFFSGFVWVWGAMGVCSLAFLFVPAVRASLHSKKDVTQKTKSPIFIVTINKVLAFSGVLLIQNAVFQGSVTVVNALTGLQYVVIIIVAVLLSRFYPNVFKEEYTPGKIVRELAAVSLVGLGLGLLLM